MRPWNWLLPVVSAGLVHAHADVLVSNLDERWTDQGIGEIHGVFASPFSGWAGVFTTGAGQYRLDSITLEHAHWGTLAIPPGFRLRLYASAEFPPLTAASSLLLELGNPTLNATPSQFPGFSQRVDYHAPTPFNLDPETTYWATTYLPSGAPDAALMFVHSTGDIGEPGWSLSDFGRVGYEVDSEVVWNVSGFGQDVLKFSVNGTVVPEPSRWAMGLVGIGLLLVPYRLLRGTRAT